MQSEFDAAQNKMPDVFFIVCLDLAQIVFRIFELPLDQKIRTIRILRVFLRLEHDLEIIVREGRYGHMVGMKLHGFRLRRRKG